MVVGDGSCRRSRGSWGINAEDEIRLGSRKAATECGDADAGELPSRIRGELMALVKGRAAGDADAEVRYGPDGVATSTLSVEIDR